MQPTFGCRLWNAVFDQNDEVLSEKVNNIIREDIYRWITGVTVDDVSVNYYSDDETKNARDIYKLYIVVKFTITSIKQSDIVEIYLDKGKV
jgi:phage baseplate assembly protein W